MREDAFVMQEGIACVDTLGTCVLYREVSSFQGYRFSEKWSRSILALTAQHSNHLEQEFAFFGRSN